MEKKAVLITFNIQSGKFESNYDRNKFFRGLYGWKQTIVKHAERKKEEKRYEYRREGILDEMPHIRVGQSSFIVPENEFRRIQEFFDEWEKKVIWRNIKIILDDFNTAFEEMDEEFEDQRKRRMEID